MRAGELLETIRPIWLTRISHRLARGEGVRESFLQQLNRFFDLLAYAIDTGDPAWLEPLISEWIHARTQTELEKREVSLPPILNIILQSTHEVACENLVPEEALHLMGVVLPVYTHALEFATQLETQLQIGHFAQEMEKANQALQQLDKSKSDFIAVAAHELRTPLTLVEGYNSMLRELLPADLIESTAALYLKGIDTGNRRMREIVEDMLDVSMIDNNLLSITYQPVWLNRILEAVRKDVESWVTERQQTLSIRSFPGSDEMFFGDGERLLQALRNLISNSIKYTPDGGEIVINGRLLPGFVEVVVSDNGIGIDPDDHNRIFEKFGRLGNVSLHSSSKTRFKGGGPGLGLPITKGIIEAHGGAIWVESEGYDENKCPGTTFHVLLPLLKAPPDDKSARLFSALTKESAS